jgi:putative endopeptidase
MKKQGVVLCLAGLLAFASFLLPALGPGEGRSGVLDREDMDLSVRPGNDFFRFACGRWVDRLALPDDRSVYRMKEMIEEARDRELKDLLDRIISRKDAPFGSDVQKIRDFYLTAADETKSGAEGLVPLEADFDRIDRLTDPASLQDLLASFQSFNLTPLFSLAVRTDLKKNDEYVLTLNPEGLGLSNRDDYLEAGEKAEKIRSAYLAHIGRMLVLTGLRPEDAAARARQALTVETRLARKTLSPLEQRSLDSQYHKLTVPELEDLCPAVDWPRYFDRVGVAPRSVIVANPDFLVEISRMIDEVPAGSWKAFFRWKLIDDLAPFLSEPFARANFEFYGAFLTGQKAPRSRKSRALDYVNQGMGELLGRIYVREYFPAERKARVEEIFGFLKKGLKARIEALDWMSPATKSEALAKLEALRLMAGYPDAWKDYSGLEILPDSFILNLKRLLGFLIRDNMALCGKSVDPDAWSGFYPQTANAGYMPVRNRIVFPAAMFRPPLFSPEGDAAVDYGALGFALAHEMMHAFDDQG